MGLMSARFSNVIPRGHPAVKMTLPDIGHEYRHDACPASGGFVLVVKNNTLVVLDKFLGCGHGTSDTYFRDAANAAKSYGLFLQ